MGEQENINPADYDGEVIGYALIDNDTGEVIERVGDITDDMLRGGDD